MLDAVLIATLLGLTALMTGLLHGAGNTIEEGRERG